MFKKSRRKIVAAIMSVLVLLWTGTLGIIYASSYIEMSEQNRQMLIAHADMYVLSQSESDRPPVMPGPDEKRPEFENSPKFRLSTFYTVALSYEGKVLEIKNDQPTLHTDSDLEKLAGDIIKGSRVTGTVDNLVFYKSDKGSYMLVTYMDNTIINESASTLLRYTFIFGSIAMVLFFFLSVFLAKKIVKPLEDSYKKQKQFISDAGHELKTPVSVVSVNAELLAKEIGDNRWLANIQYENERMGMLVGQLLKLARTESVSPQMEEVDFSRLVNGESLPFESVAFEKGLALNCNIENEIRIKGDSVQLKQVVSILLDNAIRHSDGGSEIKLELAKKHNLVRLSVINAGEEISRELRSEIFERFYRIDTARNGGDKHYGLGLAIAKAIVTAHKGRIEVLCYNGLVEFRVGLPLD